MNRLVGFVRARWLPLILSVAVALGTFPVLVFDVGDGLEGSWPVALQMSTQRRMAFGRAIAFTYGPLGALTSSAMAVPKFGLAAAWIRLIFGLGVSVFIVNRLAQVMPAVRAAVMAVPLVWTAATINHGDPLIVLFVLLACAAGNLGHEGRVPRRIAIGIGTVAGLLVIWKFDVGLAMIAAAVVFLGLETLAGRWPWRSAAQQLGEFLGAVAVTVVLAWAILGQPMGAIIDYFASSWTLMKGYGAMVADTGPPWTGPAGWIAAAGVAMLALARYGEVARRRQWCYLTFVAFALYLIARQGWTRDDNGHVVRFAAFAVLLAVALVVKRTLPQFILTGGILVVIGIALTGGTSPGFLHPSPSVRSVRRLWTMTVSSKARADRVAWGRHALPTVMQVPPTMLARMNGHTVHIDPWNTSVVWAYPQLRWDPLPVFQSYAAYTSALDHKNARKLTGPGAPQFILSEPGVIDARVPRFESPEAVLAELCNYRLAEVSTRWHLLERRPHPACGASRKLGGAKGKTMIVPAGRPDELVIARVHMNGDGLRGLLLRPRPVHLQLSPNGPQQRFIVGTAAGPHVLVLPTCLTTDTRSPRRWANFDTNPYGPLVFSRTARVEFEAITYTC